MLKENLLRFDKKQKFLVADFETYNLNLCGWGNYPWQCSFLIADQYKIYEEHDLYVDWGVEPSDFIKELTGYSAKRMREEGIKPDKAHDILRKYLDNDEYIVVGHNFLTFDTPVEATWAKALGKKVDYQYTARLLDTLCLAKSYRFDKKPDRENFLPWQYKISKDFRRNMKCKLSDLADEFGISYDKNLLHRSDYDIRLNMEVMKQLLYKVEV